MHQTSSRLLRMTDDDRPFTKVSICVETCALSLLPCCRRDSCPGRSDILTCNKIGLQRSLCHPDR
ncbi:hypothetical protein V8F20_012195 [Naviculisporaceae sp. PSN 640]